MDVSFFGGGKGTHFNPVQEKGSQMLLEALCFPQRTQTLNKWPKGTVSSVVRIVRDHASQARPGTGRVKTRHIMKPSGCGRGQKNKRQGTSELRGAPPGRIGSPQTARDTDQHVITATVTQRAHSHHTVWASQQAWQVDRQEERLSLTDGDAEAQRLSVVAKGHQTRRWQRQTQFSPIPRTPRLSPT